MAHRGQRDEYPENTMLAFQMALDNGADGLELDLRLVGAREKKRVASVADRRLCSTRLRYAAASYATLLLPTMLLRC